MGASPVPGHIHGKEGDAVRQHARVRLYGFFLARIERADRQNQRRGTNALGKPQISHNLLALEGNPHGLHRRIEEPAVTPEGRQSILISLFLARRIRRGPAGKGVVAPGHQVVLALLVFIGVRRGAAGVTIGDGAPGSGPFIAVQAMNIGQRLARIVGFESGGRREIVVHAPLRFGFELLEITRPAALRQCRGAGQQHQADPRGGTCQEIS